MPVEFVPVKSYPAAVTAFRNDQVQLAWFGGLSGVQARLLVDGARAIAQGDEDTSFVSYFIAHTDTGLTESEISRSRAGHVLHLRRQDLDLRALDAGIRDPREYRRGAGGVL